MTGRLALALAAAVLCCGCAGTFSEALSQQGAEVQLADENIVRQCQFLGDVTGGAMNTAYARNDARNRAAAMGATHVVFVSETETQALAHAYDCKTVRSPLPVSSQ
jgi:hypothetical protein